jgi:hypothetical protein
MLDMRTLTAVAVAAIACLAAPLAGCTGPADFEIDGLSLSPGTILAGGGATVTATVTNSGAAEGSYTAVLSSNGAEIATRTVTLPPGSAVEVEFTVDGLTAGSYDIEVGGSEGVLTVLGLDELLQRSQQAMSEVKSYHMTVEIDMTMDPTVSLDFGEVIE